MVLLAKCANGFAIQRRKSVFMCVFSNVGMLQSFVLVKSSKEKKMMINLTLFLPITRSASTLRASTSGGRGAGRIACRRCFN